MAAATGGGIGDTGDIGGINVFNMLLCIYMFDMLKLTVDARKFSLPGNDSVSDNHKVFVTI